MPEMTGTVTCFQLSESRGFTTIRDAEGNQETFILWFGSTIPQDLNAFTRVLHSMWVSVLREAHANGLTVNVVHPDNSAEILSMQLGQLS
jgi:hypothetical protein